MKQNVPFSSIKALIKDWGIPLAALVFTVGVFYFMLIPGFFDLQKKQKEIKEMKDSLNDVLLPKINILQKQDLAQLSDFLLTMEILVPSQPNVPLIFAIIENSARDLGLTVSVLSFSGSTAASEGQKQEVGVSFTVTGGEDGLLTFAKNLSKVFPILKVGKMTLLGAGGTDQKSLNVLLNSPYLPVSSLEKANQEIKELSSANQKILEELKKTFLDSQRQQQGFFAPTPMPAGKVNPF